MKVIYAAFIGICGLLGLAGLTQAATVTLPVPNVTGHACNALKGVITVVGFDTNGNIQASFTEQTTCAGSGRGGNSHTYTGSGVLTWDFHGGVILGYNAPLAIPGNVDQYGNSVVRDPNPNFFDAMLTIVQLPANPVYVEALVPNVIGDTPDVAEAAFVAAGIVGYAPYVNYSYGGTPNTIFNQNPAGGELVPFGTGVFLWATAPAGHGDN